MRNYFLTDDEDQDYDPLRDFERYESRDYSNLTQASKDPTIYLVPDTDPRQKRSGGGTSPFLTQPKEGEPGDIEAKQVGAQQQDMTEARLEAAQWGTEDADEDRLMPQDIQQKPPGPDSPSTEYKDPASKFMSRADERQKAYDEEWDASGKAKKFRIETTQQRAQRREAQQRDLYLSRREGVEAYGRSLDTKVKPYGQAMRMDGPEGDGIYQGYTDGTFKKVGGVLDKDEDEYSDQIIYDNQGRGMVKKRGSYETKFLQDPNAGQPLGNGMQGPTDPFVDRWVAPKKDIKVGYGQKVIDPETGEVLADGGARPVTAPRGGGRAAAAKDPDMVARKEAAEEADKLLKGDREYEDSSPETKKAVRDMWINKILKERSGDKGSGPAKPKRTVVVG